jgi:hypothetical protein
MLTTGEALQVMQIIQIINAAMLDRPNPNMDAFTRREFLIKDMINGDLTDDLEHLVVTLEDRESLSCLFWCLDNYKKFCIVENEADELVKIKRIMNKVLGGV